MAKNKKREKVLGFYGRFLSIRIIIAPIMTITIIIDTMPGSKYVSAIETVDACVGTGVGGAGSTENAVTACEGQ